MRLRSGKAGRKCKEQLILLVSVGLSPQVVTETLHALLMDNVEVPDRLEIITSRKGARLCRDLLLDEARGAIVRWGREWEVKGTDQLAASALLHVVESDSGDLADERAAYAFAQKAHEVLSKLVTEAGNRIHLSIAGGRKVASALLAMLMSMHGRPQDTMSHVLLEPAEAASSAIFFPTRNSQMLAIGERAIDASKIKINRIDIPFPRLQVDADAMQHNFQEFFAEITRALGAPRLLIDLSAGRLTWEGAPLRLPPALAAWLAWLTAAQLENAQGLPRSGSRRDNYLDYYTHFAQPQAVHRQRQKLPEILDPEWMEEKKARINKLVADAGVRPRGAYLVQRTGNWAHAYYRLALDNREIAISNRATES